MSDPLRKDNVLSIVGTVAIVGFFVLVIYLPGERACQAARHEIIKSNRAIDEMPQHISLAAAQQKRLREREASISQLNRLLDHEDDLHVVLQRVAELARAAGLKVDRIQPQTTVNRETYRVVPYQLTGFGNFRRIAAFLRGLEAEPTLFNVERFTLKSEAEQSGETLRAEITFSVFVKQASFVGSNEKSDRPTQTQADDS